MAMLIKLLIAVFFIEAILISLGIAAIPGEGFYLFISNPTDWNGNILSLLISDLFLSIGGIAIIAGTYLIKTDLIVFAGLASVLYSFGKPLGSLWVIIAAESSPLVAMFLVSPIILIYVLTIVAWWRGRD